MKYWAWRQNAPPSLTAGGAGGTPPEFPVQRCASGQDVLDCLCLLLHHRELLGKALDGVAEKPRQGDGDIEKACFVNVLHVCQVEAEMALLDHHGGHRLPELPCRDFRRS